MKVVPTVSLVSLVSVPLFVKCFGGSSAYSVFGILGVCGCISEMLYCLQCLWCPRCLWPLHLGRALVMVVPLVSLVSVALSEAPKYILDAARDTKDTRGTVGTTVTKAPHRYSNSQQ